MQKSTLIPQRLFYLDWLRVLSILCVFIFHSSRFFDMGDWHVKNPTTYEGVQLFVSFLGNWMMPLIFVISGASLFFSLGKAGKFLKDKALRLLVPLAVGIFTHIVLGVYLERLTHFQFSGSFFEFYPQYFQGMYGFGGNFAWMGLHLWYLLMLFVYCLVFFPIFSLLKGAWSSAAWRVGDWLAMPGAFYLLAIPVVLETVFVDPSSILGNRGFGGWSILGYIPFFFYGFLLTSHAGLQARIKSSRWISLALALLCTFGLVLANAAYPTQTFGSNAFAIMFGLYGLNAWLWVVTIFGFGMNHLNFKTPFLAYANEAVLPFYIMHQTVLLSIGYFIVRTDLPDFVKFLVISASSFIVIVSLYHFLIRKVNALRVLFGMKPISQKGVVPSAQPGKLPRLEPQPVSGTKEG